MNGALPKILLIDNSVNDLKLFGNALKSLSYTVLVATNTGQARELIVQKRPDVIIINPGAEGIDMVSVTAEAKSQFNTVIPVLSIYESGQDTAQSSSDYIIYKPVNINELQTKLDRIFSKTGKPSSKQNTKGPKVLVIEDDFLNRELIETILNKLNCDIKLSANGSEAIRMITADHFDLILSDLNLPDKSGKELINEIRNRLGATIPVIALSGFTDRELIAECLDLGFTDFITKPFHPSSLERVITGFLLSNNSGNAVDKVEKADKIGYATAIDLAGDNKSLLLEWLTNFCSILQQCKVEAKSIKANGEYIQGLKCFHDLRNQASYFDISAVMSHLEDVQNMEKSINDYELRFHKSMDSLQNELSEAEGFFVKEKENLEKLI